ncbi:HD domain-containing protein [Paenibacillus xylaniclasticus]|uniref:HD domain-containing protein n=1 Tax=Paenibacillus xylaniclasticus TaxID=588083 RepID=UPI0013DEE66D|nr:MULTISPECIES: HD domain-containing protein [Paenibacillus]
MQHTLGVFSLIAYFEPTNITLRVAALLHDIGHLPFSHLLEPILERNHHAITEEIIEQDRNISSILRKYSIPKDEVIKCISGLQQSLLRSTYPNVHLDHLDSWVRTASAYGQMPISPKSFILSHSTSNGLLHSDLNNGLLLFELICSEAKLHASATNLGVNAVLKNLIERILMRGLLKHESLVTMTDIELLHHLLSHDCTSHELKKLLYMPHLLRVTKDISLVKVENPLVTEVNKLYISIPIVNQRQITEEKPELHERLKALDHLRGTYYVYWSEDACSE